MDDLSFENGAKCLMQASGVGKLKPNILLMGYKGSWRECPAAELTMYFDTMQYVFFFLYLCIKDNKSSWFKESASVCQEY